jgi:putative FmdB family regulatory protein
MPTYEYVCSACQNEWEVEQSMKDNALTECPRCKEQTARRQISRGTGFILKGGGWYSDLYASSSNKGTKESSGSSEGGGSAASSSTTTTTSTGDGGGASAPAAAPAAASPAKSETPSST